MAEGTSDREAANFLGRGWAFPPAFGARDGAAEMRDAEEDIAESLWILFRTRPGERVMHPDFGCRLHDLVFEPMGPRSVNAIEVAITRAVRFFEARVALDGVDVTVDDWPGGRLEIGVRYRIRATNSRHNMVFPFYLSEGTLLSGAPRRADAA